MLPRITTNVAILSIENRPIHANKLYEAILQACQEILRLLVQTVPLLREVDFCSGPGLGVLRFIPFRHVSISPSLIFSML
jgi:hypothetical protein